MSDIISFVKQDDNVWDLIGQEDNFKEVVQMGVTKQALLNLEKHQLKKDQELLNRIITFDSANKMHIRIDADDIEGYLKLLQGDEYLQNSLSSEISGQDYESDERRSNVSGTIRYQFMQSVEASPE